MLKRLDKMRFASRTEFCTVADVLLLGFTVWCTCGERRAAAGGRVRALKEVEEAEELAEVLLRRLYAQDAWS